MFHIQMNKSGSWLFVLCLTGRLSCSRLNKKIKASVCFTVEAPESSLTSPTVGSCRGLIINGGKNKPRTVSPLLSFLLACVGRHLFSRFSSSLDFFADYLHELSLSSCNEPEQQFGIKEAVSV